VFCGVRARSLLAITTIEQTSAESTDAMVAICKPDGTPLSLQSDRRRAVQIDPTREFFGCLLRLDAEKIGTIHVAKFGSQTIVFALNALAALVTGSTSSFQRLAHRDARRRQQQ
jgi:hypothetical protein